jgi:hypothetical protein
MSVTYDNYYNFEHVNFIYVYFLIIILKII